MAVGLRRHECVRPLREKLGNNELAGYGGVGSFQPSPSRPQFTSQAIEPPAGKLYLGQPGIKNQQVSYLNEVPAAESCGSFQEPARRGGPEQIPEDSSEEPLFMYSKLRRKHT